MGHVWDIVVEGIELVLVYWTEENNNIGLGKIDKLIYVKPIKEVKGCKIRSLIVNLDYRLNAIQMDIFTLRRNKNELEEIINNEMDEIHGLKHQAGHQEDEMDALRQEILELKDQLKQWTCRSIKSASTIFQSIAKGIDLNDSPQDGSRLSDNMDDTITS